MEWFMGEYYDLIADDNTMMKALYKLNVLGLFWYETPLVLIITERDGTVERGFLEFHDWYMTTMMSTQQLRNAEMYCRLLHIDSEMFHFIERSM